VSRAWVEGDVTSVRAAIAGRYLGAEDGAGFAAERRSRPGLLLRPVPDSPRVWDLVAAADIAAYQTLRDERLATLPGVGRLTSTIVLKRVVEDRPYPVTRPRVTRGQRSTSFQ
jgi:hypothetical protein